jgi:hypothetical protein
MDLVAPDFGQHWKLLLGPILIAVAIYAHRGLLGSFVDRNRG